MDKQQVKEFIEIAAGITATVLTVVVMVRLLGGQDHTRSVKMKAAKGLETMCMNNAKMWADLAESASNLYDSNRLVTL